MNKINFTGTFLGKQLYVYDPKTECTEKEFKQYITQFHRLETLKEICAMSGTLFPNKTGQVLKGSVPVSEDILLDFAYKVIKYCNDKTQQKINNTQIEQALRMCHKLFDSTFSKQQINPEEILTKIAYRQFNFQTKNFNNLTRNYYIFTNIWYRLPSTKKIDILTVIESIIGAPYRNAIFYAYLLAGNKSGHFWTSDYDEETIKTLNTEKNINLTVESFKSFVKWCSGNYEEILDQNDSLLPFLLHPIIETKSRPIENKDDVFMVVSPQYLHDKVTSSLYFSLIDHFNEGKGKNKFKEAFGFVFQEYIGDLLKYYFKTWNVVPEIRYKKGKNRIQDSIDWFVVKGDKLIMIEVKQSSIFIKSKYRPSTKSIKTDLKKTIIHAANQLETTKNDIESKNYPELNEFNNITHFVKLIIVNDPMHNANFITKSLMKDGTDNLLFHIININDFESILSKQKDTESLFDILSFKEAEHNEMDFNEYIITMFPNADQSVDFLEPIWDDLFSKININK